MHPVCVLKHVTCYEASVGSRQQSSQHGCAGWSTSTCQRGCCWIQADSRQAGCSSLFNGT